jgi:glutamate-5-semialdehyde dehydrogenase
VIGIIYESRPNVTVDCATLCFKSGNATVLRGGKEAFLTNSALAEIVGEALSHHDLDPASVQFIPVTDRSALNILLECDDTVDCIVPRGGEGLIRFVAENSRIPVIKHYKGVCCVYIDKDADPALAEKIAVNAKVQRPSVCNAAENLFVHAESAAMILPRVARVLVENAVELRGDAATRAILRCEKNLEVTAASEEDFYEEYLDLTLAIKIVASLEEAIEVVNKYGSSHSDAIVTENDVAAKVFMAGVDSATVYWNASTRFTDGFEFGMGAEIGISTDKIHARGPMGLRELTTYKFLIYGKGQTK